MISLIDIRKSINDILKSTGIKTVASDEREGIEIIKPCFYVQLTIPEIRRDTNYDEMLIKVYIHYFPKTKSEVENLEIADVLNRIFSSGTLKIKNKEASRDILIESIEIDTYENILRYTFSIHVNEIIEDDMTGYELMKVLNLNYADDAEKEEYYGFTDF